LLNVLRKRIDHSAFIIMLFCPKETAADESVDLGAMKFEGKTAITSPTSCPASPHSACGGFASGFGLDGHTVGRLPITPTFSVTIIAAPLYQIALAAARFQAIATTSV
jgi:hypothetical protein